MSPPPSAEAATAAVPRPTLLDRWFRPVSVAREVPHDLADLCRRGTVVFVVRSAGVLNLLFLRWLLHQLGLGPLRAAPGLTGLAPWLARARSGPRALEEAVARGEPALLALHRTSGPDPFAALVAAQRRLGRPIFLVPALLVWTRRPQKLKPSLGEILFGTPDQPSRLANAVGFLLNRRRAVLRLGRPADLTQFLAERGGAPDTVLARKLRGALHYHLAGQVRAVVGPPLRPAARVREQVLRDRSLRQALLREAASSGRPLSRLEAEAARDVREIASRYSPIFIELIRPLLSWLLGRLYDAVDVDEEGLARVKRLAADAPIVLCPSHKSYMDFLVLPLVSYDHGLTVPHVAAGINLAFWPFGALARRGGAFFIRRTLKGDRVYTATLRAYVKQLLRDRFPQEFYLEGGRSRTGKLLFPKTGLFSMEVDAWLEEAAEDVLFVPVAIDYERLMEGRSYARELAGGEKRKENLRGLLRARKVLWRRYGRLSVQFEAPISLRAFVRQRLGERGAALALDEVMPGFDAPAGARGGPQAEEAKRQLVQALANHVAAGINKASTVTPVGLVAAALLSHVRRGLPAEEVAGRVELLRDLAAEDRARLSPGLAGAPADPRHPGPVADAVARLRQEGHVRVQEAAGQVIYQVVEERRTQLDYHKNAVLHRYVPSALVAAAFRIEGGAEGAPADAVRARARWLSRLFKLEFMYQVDVGFDAAFAAGVATLERAGALADAGGRLRPGPRPDRLEFLAELLRPYAEAYRAMAEALLALRDRAPLDGKALARAGLEHARAAYAAGRIALPEALSRATLENAAEWFLQQGALEPRGTDRGAVAQPWAERLLPELAAALGGVEKGRT